MEETFPQVSGPPGNAAAFQARAVFPFDEKTRFGFHRYFKVPGFAAFDACHFP